ncbi:MAG: 2-oxo acid dehydrogenase subunit E2, partial [candidate division NC10 bacterium]|nr:2-oxo acid dehydrogenase subunit E2 [candidate division NC10 bacterium]
MATRIDMPQLGLTMERGTILQWLKAEGERVEKGQAVVLIQTEKVEYEVEAPGAGTLLKVVAKEGAELPVGSLMGILGQSGEDVSGLLSAPTGAEPRAASHEPRAEGRAERAESREPRAESREGRAESREPRAGGQAPSAERRAPSAEAGSPVRAAGERIKISPVAKKLAQEHGIDIATLTASGPDGRIVREDVERAIAMKSREPRAERREEPKAIPDLIPLTGIRKVIFDRMGQSWREAAHVTLFADADMTEIVRLRQERGTDWERRFGIKPSYSDLIHMAVAKALREEPRINCRLDGQGVRVRKEVNLAFAIDLGEGLLAAVIRDADKKSLGDLAKAARDLAERARAGRLTPDDMADGTFTVSNLGGLGVEYFTPIINPPQA